MQSDLGVNLLWFPLLATQPNASDWHTAFIEVVTRPDDHLIK